MFRILAFALILFPSALQAQRPTWQQETLAILNEERADADSRELAIHGSLAAGHPRHPLILDDRLNRSAQWWCDALKQSGWFDHFGRVNARGYLVDDTGKQISRVWLPAMSLTDRTTFWWVRNNHLGVRTAVDDSSENGSTISDASPAGIVWSWSNDRKGWRLDPRAVPPSHYRNVIDPGWTHFGVGRQKWGGRLNSAFGEFVEIRE